MTQPYFYIIEHIKTKIKYAGCKWAKDSNPSNFWVDGGYFTSSGTIKDIINLEGSTSFRVICIKTEIECGMSVYNYETRWLNDHDCAKSKSWFNNHNNQNDWGNVIVTDGLRSKRSLNRIKWLSDEVNLNIASENLRKGVVKLKEKYKGSGNPFYGKSHSKDSKDKISNSKIGSIAWNKGTNKHNCDIALSSSERMKKNNPIKNMDEDKKKEMYSKNAKNQIGKRWFHCPETQERIFVFPDNVPEGFIRGMGKKS